MPELAAIAILGLFAGSLVALAMRSADSGTRVTRAIAGFGSAAAACAVLVAAATHRVPAQPPRPRDLPLQEPAPDDVASVACRSCHPDQYASWHASYHRTMTQTVSARSVLGDFRDVQLSFGRERYRLFEREGEFIGEISTPAQSERARTRTVRLEQMTGSHHMQIYWYASGAGRMLEAFPLVWLRAEQRWIPRLAAFVTPPSDHPTPTSVWNTTCIGCHTTHPRPRLSASPIERADSEVTELGIACEACHGSGREHARFHRSPLNRYRAHFATAPDAAIVDPSRLSHVRSSQVCGQCHSVKTFYSEAQANDWALHGSGFRPGDDLDAAVNIITTATLARPYTQEILNSFPDFYRGSFWDDGIVRVVGREYNALIESGCFQRGELACISCHEMHQTADDPRDRVAWANDQLAPEMESDRACTQCHESFAGAEREHTHHAPGSTGSACQNCHMPHTTYGLLKAVRSHEIGSPRVSAAGPSSARPNACNLCHLDRSLGWSAGYLTRWYEQPMPALGPDDERIATGARWALTGDAGVRALVAWSMGWAPAQRAAGTDWLVPYLLDLMEDPYDAVRMIASRSLATLPGQRSGAFDPLASPEQRTAAAEALRERGSLPPADRDRAAAMLFDAQGQRLAGEIMRLRAQRDDRPLNLAE